MCTGKSSTARSHLALPFFTDEVAFFSDRLLTDQKQRSRRYS